MPKELPPSSSTFEGGDEETWALKRLTAKAAFRNLARGVAGCKVAIVSELIFEVKEDAVDGGYSASALGYGIHTEGETLEELRANVKEAVDCYFDETMDAPKVIRLHFVRDEVLAR
jgi:predicted RNase H-like HicB family nuclease